MKTLVVHPGYPKTATTLLQKRVFNALDAQGHLRHLGRWAKGLPDCFKGGLFFTSLLRDASPTLLARAAPFDRIEKEWSEGDVLSQLTREKRGVFAGLLAEDRVNLYSDEGMTSPYRSVVPFDAFPRRIRRLFDDGSVDFRVVFTLRRQPDLLASYYAQSFSMLRQETRWNSMQKMYFPHGNLDINNLYVKFAEFSNIILPWANEFGLENIYFMYYEDIKNKPLEFSDVLASILDLSPKLVSTLFSNSMTENVKVRESDGSYVIFKSLRDILIEHGVMNRIQSKRLTRVISALASELHFRESITSFSINEVKALERHFSVFNEELVDNFGVQRADLQDRGYATSIKS